MTTSIFHSNYSNTPISKGSRKNHKQETLFSVEVYGEDGDYQTFEVMAENKETANAIAEQRAQNMMTDICYIAIYPID